MSEKRLNVEISGTNYDITDREQNYITKKCEKLIDYIPRRGRESAFAAVRVTMINQKNDNKYQIDATLTLPDKTLSASDTAPNALAAIDIVEEKLRGQIRRYKTERRNDGVRTGGWVAKLKRSLRRK